MSNLKNTWKTFFFFFCFTIHGLNRCSLNVEMGYYKTDEDKGEHLGEIVTFSSDYLNVER